MCARRSTRAPTIRCPTRWSSRAACASAPSLAPALSISRRRGASISGGGGSVRGYGYQQLGPKDVDGDPIGGRGLAEFALEARIRLKQFGGNFGVVPFFDGGSLSTEHDARLQAMALRGRRLAFATIRSSGRSASTSACRSTARRATVRSPSPSRSGRPSNGRRRGRRTVRLGAAEGPPAAATGAGACSTSCSRSSSRCCSCSRRSSCSSTAPPVIASSSTSSASSRRPRACASTSAASTARSSASRSFVTSRSPTRRGVFLTSPDIKLDWAPGAWLYTSSASTGDRRSGHPDPAARPQAEREEGADPPWIRHPRRRH